MKSENPSSSVLKSLKSQCSLANMKNTISGTEDTSPEEPPLKPIWTTPMNNGSGGPPIIRQQVQQKSHRSHHNHHHSSHQQQHNLTNLSNTVSQVTVSTQSTGSNASWEDRSVGGKT